MYNGADDLPLYKWHKLLYGYYNLPEYKYSFEAMNEVNTPDNEVDKLLPFSISQPNNNKKKRLLILKNYI